MKLKKYMKESTRPRMLNEIFIQFQDALKSTGSERDKQFLRVAIIAEYDAANLYENMAKQTANSILRDLLLDIANEEKAHIGEFEAYLEELDPDHEKYEDEGEDEAEEKFGIGNEED